MTSPPTSPFTDEDLARLLDLGLDFVFSRRAADFVAPAHLLGALDEALSEPRVARLQSRWLAPQRARLFARAHASETRLSAWLPAGASEAIAALLGEPAPLPRPLVDEMVSSDRVREEVRAMLNETLSSFIARAVGGSEAPAGSLRSALGRSALGFAAAGKTLLGGLGGQVQKQLQERVRDFVDGSVAAMQGHIADKLLSPETAETLGKRRREAFLQALSSTEAEAAAFVEAQLPHARLEPLAPSVIAHNLRRPAVRELIESELAEVLRELSTQTVGELLDELGLRARVRAASHEALVPLMRAFAETEGFAAFAARLAVS